MFRKYGAPFLTLPHSIDTNFSNIEKIPEHVIDWSDFKFNPNTNAANGFLYRISRAISTRVNANYDGWPVDQVKQSYKTFNGRPCFVEHNNADPKRARGVILASIYRETKLGSGIIDGSVYCLDGELNGVSMGADVQGTICSACGKYASKPAEYCAHIPKLKGQMTTVYKSGRKIESRVWENCIKPNFFELSSVFDPADESSLIIKKFYKS
jgi:hypothetical protein